MRFSTECAALLLGAAVAASAHPTRQCNTAQFLNVTTTNGPIAGHPAPNSDCVVEYLGIPYAQPPVGDLRFAAPQRFNGSAPYEAANFGFDCPLSPSKPVDYPGYTPQAQQIVAYFATGAGTPQSEDCLTLNVWSKATGRSLNASKPVLVFFYGGRFAIGNTNTPFYTGKYLADAEDIVVVTVNYRINLFGFPGAPGQTQNLGLRDQRVAVEWVRDNIQQFGGDASKITISGQSAGGASVDYWSYAYQEDPIAHGIIAHSGNAFSFPFNAAAVTEKNWNSVVAAVNCTSDDDVMACVRRADWEDLKAAAASIKSSPSSSVLRTIPAFYPMPDDDVVFSDYTNLTESGSFANIPILFGNNNNEDGYYRIAAYANGIVPTDEQVTSFLLESFTCPVSAQASARSDFGVPSWAYRYMADWNNTRLYPTSGAYHGVDLHMVYGASEDVSGLPTSKSQRQLTQLMQHAWFLFSNDPSHGLYRMGWPRFDQNQPSLIVLGQDNTPTAQLVLPSEYNALCSNVTLGAL